MLSWKSTYYYELGLRSLGIVWSRPNVFGNGVPFVFPSTPDIGEGLSLAGKSLVRQCNNKGFYDVASISAALIVVSHAGVHDICSSSTNVLDEQLRIIKQSNGEIPCWKSRHTNKGIQLLISPFVLQRLIRDEEWKNRGLLKEYK